MSIVFESPGNTAAAGLAASTTTKLWYTATPHPATDHLDSSNISFEVK